MKTVNVIVALVVFAWLALVGWGAWRVYDAYMIGRDPLRAEKLALKQAELERLTEQEKQKTEEQKRKTARTLAAIDRRARLESNQGVTFASVALAVTWRMTFPVLLLSGLTGAGVYLYRKPVLFEFEGVKAYLPRHAVPEVTQQALVAKERAEMVKALAYAESVTKERVEQIIETVKALKPGRETVNISNAPALPAATEQQAGNVAFQQAVRDFKQDHILIGYDSDGQPVFFPLNGFVSCAFGGGSGSGKTSKLRFLTAQLILNGVNVSILDAHKGNEQSLVDSLGNLANMPNVRIFNPFETHQAVDVMLSDVQHAIDSGKPADAPNVFILDELRPLNKACSDTELLMDKLSNEGRKFGFFGVFASQTWEAKMFKQSGSAARDACVLKMAARMPKQQARTLFQDGESARTVARLEKPEMFADSVQYSGVVTVPFCSRSDLDELAASRMSKNHNRNLQAGRGDVENELTTEDTTEHVNASEGKIDNVVPFRRRNAEETAEKRQTKTETAFLSADTLREILAEKLARNEETLSGIANKANVSKGQLYRFLKENQNPSENLLTALQVFAGTAGTPANPTGTEA